MDNFCILKRGYHLSYDHTRFSDFTFKNLRLNLRYFLCGPPQSEGEGIYYRIIHNQQKTCIQCIIFYKTQWVPYHPHDYHPFYIYLDAKNCVEFLLIDDGHHFSKLIPIKKNNRQFTQNITIFLPDHGLTNQLGRISKIFKPKLLPLLPEQIVKWWTINNMAQLKLRSKLIDPWASGLIPDKPTQKDSIIYRLNHLVPLKMFPFAEKDLYFTFRDESICPKCQSLDTLDFMSYYYNNTTGNHFLTKKMTCKNNHTYDIRFNFKKGEIEYF